MTFPTLFVNDEEHSDKLYLAEGIRLTTGGLYDESDKWSRFVIGEYKAGHGFLTTNPYLRIKFYVFERSHEDSYWRYLEDYPQDYLAEQLNARIQPETLSVIHYHPGSSVSSLLLNLPLDTEDLLPKRLRYPYT